MGISESLWPGYRGSIRQALSLWPSFWPVCWWAGVTSSRCCISILSITIQSSIAVLFATVGEVFTERSGVLNLGIEGMMLMGALSGFAATYYSHSLFLGILTSLAVGGMLALIHGFFTISLRANQVVCGLALTILGIGLSSFLGRSIIGRVGERFVPFPIPLLREIPILGPVLFNQTPLTYLSYLLVTSSC